MFENGEDLLERVIRTVRRPVPIDPALDRRIMARIARDVPRRGRFATMWKWLIRARPIRVSPAAVVAATAIFVAAILIARGSRSTALPVPPPGTHEFAFVLVEPRAASVALVGDFNDWDPGRTPMRRTSQDVWSTVLPLTPGRYRYAFLVDGAHWVADPSAPTAGDDTFGAPSSVLTVGGS